MTALVESVDDYSVSSLFYTHKIYVTKKIICVIPERGLCVGGYTRRVLRPYSFELSKKNMASNVRCAHITQYR